MSVAGARRVASTACAAVALILVSDARATVDPPVCTAPPAQTAVSEYALELDLFDYCSDPDFDELAFDVTTEPTNGTVEILDGFLYYTSAAGYAGPDTVSFTVTAGGETTAPTPVSITVVANQPPTCPADLELEVDAGDSAYFDPWFDCDDDGDIVDFPILDPPDHGTLGPYDYVEGFVYTPAAGFSGSDAFTVVAEDHAGVRSDPIVFTVTVLAVNRAPTCVQQLTVNVPFAGRVTVSPGATCSDPDGDAVSFVVVSRPLNGRLEPGAAGTLAYTANPGFVGYDRMLYRGSDPAGAESDPAALDFLVAAPPLPAAPPTDVSAPVLGVARAGSGKLGAVRRNGLKLRLTSNESATARVTLSVPRRTARRLRIDRKATGPVEIGSMTQSLAPGDSEVVVRLSTRARRRLARTRRVTLTVVVFARDVAGNAATKRLDVTLRR